MSTFPVKSNCTWGPWQESKGPTVPSVQVLDVFQEQASLVLAEVLACLQVVLLLVQDELFASSLISEKIDAFLEVGSFSW